MLDTGYRALAYYRLYILGSSGRIISFRECECEDDAAAETFAAGVSENRRMELWQGNRKVRDFPISPNAFETPCGQ